MGKELRKVEERSEVPTVSPDETGILVDTLRRAINERRGAISAEPDTDDDGEWSD